MINLNNLNKKDIINFCLDEASVILESIDEKKRDKEINDLKDQISHLNQNKRYGSNINYYKQRLEKLESDKAMQKYYDEHEDKLPQLKKSKNGKILYEYKSNKVDTDTGSMTLTIPENDKFTYATNIDSARRNFIKKFSRLANKDIGISVQDIDEVYEIKYKGDE